MKLLLLVAAALVAGCSASAGDCTLVAAESGIVVDSSALRAGVTGEVCIVDGPCGAVPAQNEPLVLPLPDEAATVVVEVHLATRPVERLSVRLQPVYPNGRQCGAAGHQGTVHLTDGASTVD